MAGKTTARKAAPEVKLSGRKESVPYSAKLAKEICRRLGEGESWTRISQDDDMPSYGALYQWSRTHKGFAVAVRAARDRAADRAADEVLEVARAATAATASADRVKIGALQWSAAKAAPHRYGARAETQPQKVEIVVRVKRYEKLQREDGSYYLREILPEGRK